MGKWKVGKLGNGEIGNGKLESWNVGKLESWKVAESGSAEGFGKGNFGRMHLPFP